MATTVTAGSSATGSAISYNAPAKSNLRVRSGNKIRVFVNDVNVGLVQSLRASDDYSPEPASGIGNIEVQEWVPSMAKHSIAVSHMTLIGQAFRSAVSGDYENGEAMLKGTIFDIAIFGDNEGTPLRKYIGCSYASGDVDVSAHKIVVSNATFNALSVTGLGV